MSTLGVIPNWADPLVRPARCRRPGSSSTCAGRAFSSSAADGRLQRLGRKLGADPWVGFAIMAVVMLPGFAALEGFHQSKNIFGSQVDVVRPSGCR